MANVTMTITPHGSIELAGVTTNEALMEQLPSKEKTYVRRLNERIGELTSAEAALAAEEVKLVRRLSQTAEARKLAEIRAKRRLIRAERSDATMRQQGVLEAHLEEYMPGASLGEKISSLIGEITEQRAAGRKKLGKGGAR